MGEKVSKDLRSYIDAQVFPLYMKNDEGHGLRHMRYVIARSLDFAMQLEGVNFDMVYAIAAYHDVGHHIDKDRHEQISAGMLRADTGLATFFGPKQIQVMTDAVEDHRSISEREPRSIYGKIVSSADRNVFIDDSLRRTYTYRRKHTPDAGLAKVVEESRQHVLEKFGKNGYAKEKIYFDDPAYRDFLAEIGDLVEDQARFKEKYLAVNKELIDEEDEEFKNK